MRTQTQTRNAYAADPGASSGLGSIPDEDSDEDEDEDEPPVVYIQPSSKKQQRRNRRRRNRTPAQPASASIPGISFANGGLDFIPLDSSDSSTFNSDSSDDNEAEIDFDLTFNDGPIEHFTPHHGRHHSADNSGEDDDDGSITESLILAHTAVPPISGPGPIISDMDDIALQYARLNLDKERERERDQAEVLLSVTRLPPPAPRTSGARARKDRLGRGRSNARATGGTSPRAGCSRSRVRAGDLMDMDEDSGELGEGRETAHERFERRRREKTAADALNEGRRRKRENQRKRRRWFRLLEQRPLQREQRGEEGRDERQDELAALREEVLLDPYVRMMLASDSSSSDYDDMGSFSSSQGSDVAEGTTHRARDRDRSRVRKRARPSNSNTGSGSGANIPLSRQRRFRADDPIPLDDSARIIDDEENDDLYAPEPGSSKPNPALRGRPIIPYAASGRDKLLAFDKSRKTLNVDGASSSSSRPGQGGHDFASLAAREIDMWRHTRASGQVRDTEDEEGESMDLDMGAHVDFAPLSSVDMDTVPSTSASTAMAGRGGRVPLFLSTPTPVPESVASSSFRPPIPPASAFIPPVAAPKKKRTPTPEPEIPLPQRIAMEIAARGVPNPDEDDDLPDFEDDDDAGEELGEAEVTENKKEDPDQDIVKKERRARERNEEIRKIKEQEWETLRYVCPTLITSLRQMSVISETDD